MDSGKEPQTRARNFTIGAAIANLWFLPVAKLVLLSWVYPTTRPYVLPPSYYIAAAAALVLMVIICWAAVALIDVADKYIPPFLVTGVFLAGLVFILRRLRRFGILRVGFLGDYFRWMPHVAYILFCLLLLLLGIYFVHRHAQLLRRFAYVALMLLFPFALIVLGQLLMKGLLPGPYAPWGEAGTGRAVSSRLVLIVFDELDSRALTTARPDGMHTSSFDALSAVSTTGTRVTSPSDATELAIPSMLTGVRVDSLGRDSDGQLTLIGNGITATWADQPNVFSAVAKAGKSFGIVGWYHSYCASMGVQAKRCWTTPPIPLPQSPSNTLQKTLGILRTSYYDERAYKGREIERDSNVRRFGLQLVTDSTIDFVYLHLPLPHAPSLRQFRGNHYLGNVIRADSTLGVLRAAMENAGLWDDAAIIVTGDHGTWAKELDSRAATRPGGTRSRDVPLMIKLPGQSTPFVINKAISTRVLASLVPAILAGRVATSGQLEHHLMEKGSE